MKRIIFMGTPAFAATVLEGLLTKEGIDVVGVVTQPDRPVGRKRILTPPPVKEVAIRHQLPIFQPEKISEQAAVDQLIALEADLIVTAAYGQFVPTKLIDAPPYKAINVHASLLPKYRGGAPIHYAIWNGDKETGISIIYMTKKMDAGDILAQKAIAIESSDDVGIQFEKLAIVGRDLLLETMDKLFLDEIEPFAQDEDQVIFSPTITKEQEAIVWSQEGAAIANHVRAFRPFPGTYSLLDGQRVKIWDGEPVSYEDAPGQVGEIVAVKDQAVIVQAGNETFFAITDWQENGKKRLTIQQWLNGNKPEAIIGKVFNTNE